MQVYVWYVEKLDTMISVVFRVCFDESRHHKFTSYVSYKDLHVGITNEEIIDMAWNQIKETVNNYKYWSSQLSLNSLIGTKYIPKD